ncbi:MAG: deoxyribose-phosphate aldolase [Deferribacteres bacterium]|nr:deoxyribose-phosphate aldolase [candidate division KSB1 bacterium]MCB9502791.1 deoxyribose-phosphate aldolase [Deferribacteres bacterium]
MQRIISLQNHNGEKVSIASPPIDAVMLHERADSFTKRSVKKQSKMDALYKCIEMIDLTTLEGADTVGKVKQLCSKARFPITTELADELAGLPNYKPIPQVAAVCVYPSMVQTAKDALRGTTIKVASVATAFPAGQIPLKTRLQDVKDAVSAGADEIDMVINRGAFLAGDYQTVFDEIEQVKAACDKAHLKVILETGELSTYDKVRLASEIAMEAGADFIKTSTGKVSPAATIPVTLVMLQAILDFYDRTGKIIGMKPAGGIRNAKQAIHYLVMVNEVMGPRWLTPDLFRFGASSLLNDILKQIYKQVTGRYAYDKSFSLD